LNTNALWNANQLQGKPITPNAPTQGYVLKWFPANIQQWEAAPDNDSNPWSLITGGIQYQGSQVLTNEMRIGGTNGSSLKGSASSLEVGLAGTAKVGLYSSGAEWGPTLHNTVKLGSTSFRWSEIWSVNGLNQSSDERLKKDIHPLTSSLEKIKRMNPVSYRWKEEDGHTHLGFLAQELENVLPEIVRKPETQNDVNTDGRTIDPLTDTYAVNYSEIIPVLVKAMQEQQEIIMQLEKRLAAMENNKDQKN
ncbi:MAG: tail fiber domain-containing protein, partial [Saprospiraceae bacterium]